MKLPRPVLDLDFVPGVTPASITFSRADATTCATYVDACGLIWTVPAGVLRDMYDANGVYLGKLVEEARINRVTSCRDLTGWTKSNTTITKTATGVDNTANSASIITATATDGTASFAITSASASRAFSAYVKRITGAGAISVSVDGGATWLDITAQLSTSTWSRPYKVQTVTNPTVMFKIGSNGDAIAVDYVQCEDGLFPTSAIYTSGAAATRAADYPYVTLSGLVDAQGHPLFATGQGTLLVEGCINYVGATASYPVLASLYTDATHYADIFINDPVADAVRAAVVDGTSQAAFDLTSAVATGQLYRAALAFKTNLFAGCAEGKTVYSDTAGTVPAVSTLGLGHVFNLYRLNGCIRRLTLWNRELSACIKSLTARREFTVAT